MQAMKRQKDINMKKESAAALKAGRDGGREEKQNRYEH